MNRLVLSSASLFALCSVPAWTATLAPHRAYYDLDVARVESGNNITNIKGKLAFEITGSDCDGYATSYRMANRIRYVEGGTQVLDIQLTSWESADGLLLDVTQKQYLDASLTSDSRVKVTKEAAGGPGKGLITKADTKEFATTPATMFPVQYQLGLIGAAARGEGRNVAVVFEGGDDDKAMRAISFIGERKPVTGLPEANIAALAQSAAWPVTVSYYSEDAREDEQPIYQANFLMLDNGISTNLLLDYGSYALSGKLTKLELLKADSCP